MLSLEAMLRNIYHMGDGRLSRMSWKQLIVFCTDYVRSVEMSKAAIQKTIEELDG